MTPIASTTKPPISSPIASASSQFSFTPTDASTATGREPSAFITTAE